MSTGLSEAETTTLLAPCPCGHSINDHGSLVPCWLCEDDGNGQDCGSDFEALLCERVATIVAGRVEASAEAKGPGSPGEGR